MEAVDDQRLYSGRYRITHLIARGGMATVYRAHDTLLNRYVALKILYPELSEDPTFVERFRREAQAAANLSHPNIVPVFDWGEDQGTYFIVMELVEGTSLAELLRGGKTLSPARASQIVAQAAGALGYANRSGVVHRDVKPGNILLTRDGQVKVTDFGIAQAVASNDHLAQEGSVMGTATYFSPEQAGGAAVDGRSDVYSLGVVLYEIVVGRPPFVGESPVEVSEQHVRSVVPPPSTFSSSVPPDLEAIILSALAKSPEDRYQSADELRADLLRFTEGQPVKAATRGAFFGSDATRAVGVVSGGEHTQAVPIMSGPRTDIRRRRRRTNYLAWIVAVVVVLAAAGAAGYYVAHRPKNVDVPHLVGLTAKAATRELKADGLNLGQTSYKTSKKKVGLVLSTSPKGGTKVKKGSYISLVLSQGQSTSPVTVPQVTGLTLSDAQQTLLSKNLKAKVVPVNTAPTSGNWYPNEVVYQSPPYGQTVQTGSTVEIQVLSSNAKFGVANVTGDSTVTATSTLTEQGLIVTSQLTKQCSSTVPSGTVIGTTPPAGTMVVAHSTVALIVSTGHCPVVVENVVGDPESTASSIITGQGLQPSFTSDTSTCAPGASPTVVTETPLAGTSVRYGSTVILSLCVTSSTTTTG